MDKNKHLILNDRKTIQYMLDNRKSFKAIADALEKDPITISKEIRSHLQFRRTGAFHIPYNACVRSFNCQKSHICSECHASRGFTLCRRCSMCNTFCREFEQEHCSLLKNRLTSAMAVQNAPPALLKSTVMMPTLPIVYFINYNFFKKITISSKFLK